MRRGMDPDAEPRWAGHVGSPDIADAAVVAFELGVRWQERAGAVNTGGAGRAPAARTGTYRRRPILSGGQ
jgi:hypothetical protein